MFTPASEPPVTIKSDFPNCISIKESIIALFDEAQAETVT